MKKLINYFKLFRPVFLRCSRAAPGHSDVLPGHLALLQLPLVLLITVGLIVVHQVFCRG